MSQNKVSKFHDPWLTGSLVLFSFCLACGVFFQKYLNDSGLVLGFSVFGFLVTLVYATLPNDAEGDAAYFTAKVVDERKAESGEEDDDEGFGGIFLNVCLVLAFLSFIALVVSIVLALFFGLTDTIFLMEAVSASVFWLTFQIVLLWPIVCMPHTGFTPWWWGL